MSGKMTEEEFMSSVLSHWNHGLDNALTNSLLTGIYRTLDKAGVFDKQECEDCKFRAEFSKKFHAAEAKARTDATNLMFNPMPELRAGDIVVWEDGLETILQEGNNPPKDMLRGVWRSKGLIGISEPGANPFRTFEQIWRRS